MVHIAAFAVVMLTILGPAYTGHAPHEQLTCVACRDGFFLDDAAVAGGGDPLCRRCPVNMFTRPGRNASEQTHCLCSPGWSNSTGAALCQACLVGEFKPVLGNVSCSSCPADSSTLGTNSTSIDFCFCNPGFTPTAEDEHVCAACVPGTFKGDLADEACAQCPANKFCEGQTVVPTDCVVNSVALAGSDEVYDCSCKPGFLAIFSVNGPEVTHVCQQCAAGRYNDAFNQSACQLCPTNTFLPTTGADNVSDCLLCDPNAASQEGSTAQTDCFCNLGYSGVPGAECQACMPGEYRSNPDEYICQKCPANTYNGLYASSDVAECNACPSDTVSLAGSDALIDCTCVPGFSASVVGDAYQCTPCVAGTFQPVGNQSACLKCPAGTASTAVQATAQDVCITCNAGFFTTTEGATKCRACAPSTFQDQALANPTAQPCTACPSNSRHNINGSIDITDCRCDAGFAQRGNGADALDPHRCEVCRAGYFCPGDGDEFLCPPNHYSEEGSIVCTRCANNSQALSDNIVNVDECKCVPGAEGSFDDDCTLCEPGFAQPDPDGGTCVECEPDTFATGRGNLECTVCPGNSSAPSASDAITDCVCRPGFFGPDGGPCALCEADTVCPGGSQVDPCRAHSSGPPGLSEQAGCVCDPGFVSENATARCQPCPPGFFCPGGQVQTPCSAESHSVRGSIDITACVCDPGYWRQCIVDTTTGLAVDAQGQPCVIDYAAPCQLCMESVICANNTLIHCPANSTAPAGSHEASHCECDPGFKEVHLAHVH